MARQKLDWTTLNPSKIGDKGSKAYKVFRQAEAEMKAAVKEALTAYFKTKGRDVPDGYEIKVATRRGLAFALGPVSQDADAIDLI